MLNKKIKLIILDTNIIREFIYNEKLLDDFLKIQEDIKDEKDKFIFRLGETTVAELIRDLFDGSITFSDWKKFKSKINLLLSKDLPIQCQGNDLGMKMQIYKTKKKYRIYSNKYWKRFWEIVINATSAEVLSKNSFYFENHQKGYIKLDRAYIDKVFEDEKNLWIQYFDEIEKNINDCKENQPLEIIINLLIEHLENDYHIEKVEPMIYSIAYKILQSSLKNTPYNPSSNKRKNDTFDFSFLQVLNIPAIFCSLDVKFINALKNENMPLSDQLMTPDELSNYLSNIYPTII